MIYGKQYIKYIKKDFLKVIVVELVDFFIYLYEECNCKLDIIIGNRLVIVFINKDLSNCFISNSFELLKLINGIYNFELIVDY